MSSRVPGAGKLNVAPYRQEDDRKRDEARLVTLQNQVDELRQALRELASRQVRIEEGIRGHEGSVAQNRMTLDAIRQESTQSLQARALDENRTRQVIAELEQRLEDATRPIRSLQAHVSELIEASRRKTDDSGQHIKRYDELRALIEHLSAVGDRNAVVTHQLRDSIDNVRGEADQLRRDVLRNEDAIKIVDQEARRRVAEVAQTGENFSARLDEIRSDVSHNADLIEEYRRSIVHIDPALQELRVVDDAIRQDLTRFNTQAIERHEVIVDRLEDIRQATDGQFAEIRQAAEQRYERLGERIDEVNELHREVGFRIGTVAHQLDELRMVDATLRREMWQLHEARVRMRLEQAQAELDLVTGQRRVGEGEGQTSATETKRTTVRPGDR